MISNNYHNIKSSYYEVNKEESTLLNYQRVNIEQYLQHFLLQKGLLLQNLLFQTNEKSLNLIIYYYTLNYDSTLPKRRTSKTCLKLKKVQLRQYSQKNKNPQVRILKKRVKLSYILTLPEIRKNVFKKNYSDLKFNNDISINREYKIFNNKVSYLTTNALKKNYFHEHILEAVSLFLKKRFHVSLVFKNINRGVSLMLTSIEKAFLKKQAILLKTHSKQKYFKDCLNLFIIGAKIRCSSKLFSIFLTEHLQYLKYHKSFLSFVVKFLKIIIFSNNFVLKGIKFIISGRLNNKPRSSSFVVIIGNIPTITKSIETMDYSENTCYTKNGTFGIKVWCNHF